MAKTKATKSAPAPEPKISDKPKKAEAGSTKKTAKKAAPAKLETPAAAAKPSKKAAAKTEVAAPAPAPAAKKAAKKAAAKAEVAAPAPAPAAKKPGKKAAAKKAEVAAPAPAPAAKKPGKKAAAKKAEVAAPAPAPKKPGKKAAAKKAEVAAPAPAPTPEPKKPGKKAAAKTEVAAPAPAPAPKKPGKKAAAKTEVAAPAPAPAPKKPGKKAAAKTEVAAPAPTPAPKKPGKKAAAAKVEVAAPAPAPAPAAKKATKKASKTAAVAPSVGTSKKAPRASKKAAAKASDDEGSQAPVAARTGGAHSREPAEFAGFGPGLFEFLADLAMNNDRDWFAANKHRYEAEVREPALAFIRAVGSRMAQISEHFVASDQKVGGSLMRIHRDTRFAPDKTPYKTNLGVQFRHAVGKDIHAPGLYFHVDHEGVFIAAGTWHPEAEPLAAIRAAILERPGAWKAARDDASFVEHWRLEGDSLSRPPRGVAKDHPLVDDLRRKDHIAMSRLEVGEIMRPDMVDKIVARYASTLPYLRFLCTAIGVPC